MLCRVPGGKSFLGCGTMTILPSSCLSFIWLPLWLTRTNPSFSSLLRTSLLFISFLYATCATKSRENAYVAHRTLLVTGYEKRRLMGRLFSSNQDILPSVQLPDDAEKRVGRVRVLIERDSRGDHSLSGFHAYRVAEISSKAVHRVHAIYAINADA